MAEKIKGYMTVKVEEASGKNKRDEYKWDGYDFEGFVKGMPSRCQQHVAMFCPSVSVHRGANTVA